MVSTLDSESNDPSSNLGGTYNLFSFFPRHARRSSKLSKNSPRVKETGFLVGTLAFKT